MHARAVTARPWLNSKQSKYRGGAIGDIGHFTGYRRATRLYVNAGSSHFAGSGLNSEVARGVGEEWHKILDRFVDHAIYGNKF